MKLGVLIIVLFLLTLGVLGFLRLKPRDYQNQIEAEEAPLHTTDFVPEKMTLDKVFEETDGLPDSAWSIIFTGDVMLGRKVNANTIDYDNFNWSFEKVADELSEADIAVINLEGTIIRNCPVAVEGFKFCGDQRHVVGLGFAGVDIANLANNHSDNYGLEGLRETKEILSEKDIKTFNQNEPLFLQHNSLNIAFLGYNVIFQESAPLIPKITREIANLRDKSDLIITSFHWGDEYTATPNTHQINLAHASIDAGADVVIGHHPHWIQTAEVYKDKLILYSLGNFIFDQMWSQKTREGVAAKLWFYDSQLVDIELMPVIIEDFGQPYFLEGEEKSRIINEMKLNSN